MNQVMNIVWKGDTRNVPGFGELEKGDERVVARSIGESLVQQGLAKEQTKKKSEKTGDAK